MSTLQFGSNSGHFNSPWTNCEPMALGSPTSNINSLSPQFLPSFLMGDNNNTTPSKAIMSSTMPQSSPLSQFPNQSRMIHPRLSGLKSSTPLETNSRRHASPPTQGLWSNNLNTSRYGSQLTEEPRQGVENMNYYNSPLPNLSYLKSDIGSPNYPNPRSFLGDCSLQFGTSANRIPSSAEDDSSNLWITVFGYPAAQASFILQQFSYLGTIEKYFITNNGNWMHIKYQNAIQAKCALNKNGRVFSGNIMIGVRRCTDSEIMQGSKATSGDLSSLKNDIATRADPKTSMPPPIISFKSPALADVSNSQDDWRNRSLTSLNSISEQRPTGLARHSSMRPLAASYRPPRGVLSRNTQGQYKNSNSVNAKSSGLLSKAFDYVFGWN